MADEVVRVTVLEKRAAIDRLVSQLPELPSADRHMVMQMADVNEFGVALENLCIQLYEFDIGVRTDILQEIAALGNLMGISPEYWGRLRVVEG
jgi:hypothetical protein